MVEGACFQPFGFEKLFEKTQVEEKWSLESKSHYLANNISVTFPNVYVQMFLQQNFNYQNRVLKLFGSFCTFALNMQVSFSKGIKTGFQIGHEKNLNSCSQVLYLLYKLLWYNCRLQVLVAANTNYRNQKRKNIMILGKGKCLIGCTTDSGLLFTVASYSGFI